jgi:hypothetical protein
MGDITKQELIQSLGNEITSATNHTSNELMHNEDLQLTRSGKDANGIFTNVQYNRKSDSSLYKISILSGGTTPNYTTRTETYYATDGVTVIKTITYTLSYDSDNAVTSEV